MVSLLRKTTMEPWYSDAQQAISAMMKKVLDILKHCAQKHGAFGASL